MTSTTTTLVANTLTSTVPIESELNPDLQAVRPASAAHIYTPAGEVADNNPLPTKLPSGSETAIYTLATGTGSTSSTAVTITVANIGSAVGLINGKTFPVGATVTWRASPGKTLSAISYDATGTSFIISGTQNG